MWRRLVFVGYSSDGKIGRRPVYNRGDRRKTGPCAMELSDVGNQIASILDWSGMEGANRDSCLGCSLWGAVLGVGR